MTALSVDNNIKKVQSRQYGMEMVALLLIMFDATVLLLLLFDVTVLELFMLTQNLVKLFLKLTAFFGDNNIAK